MIKLKQILNEILLEEISERTTLYHRSPIKLSTGDVIKPKFTEKGSHWLSDSPFEIAMEYYRQQYHKDKPSRLNCIYSSLIPRSRFVDKGYVYEIKPHGRILVTDSSMIDTMVRKFDDALYVSSLYRTSKYGTKEREEFLKDGKTLADYFLQGEHYYWTGVAPTKNNLVNIEVLSDSAVVVGERIESEKTTPFRAEDDVIVTENNKIIVGMEFYINTDSGYKSNTKEDMTIKEVSELIKWVKDNLFSKISDYTIPPYETYVDENEYYHFKINGYLKKGSKLKIIGISSSKQRVDMGDIEHTGKFNTILFNFYKNGELMSQDKRKNNKNFFHRTQTAKYYYGNDDDAKYNFAKYLKKI